GAVAVVELNQRAVGGAGAGHVQALAQHGQRAAGADRPLLGVGAVAGVDLDRVAVGRAGGLVVQAQVAAFVRDDLPGARGRRGGATATAIVLERLGVGPVRLAGGAGVVPAHLPERQVSDAVLLREAVDLVGVGQGEGLPGGVVRADVRGETDP